MLEPGNNDELPPIPGKRYFTIGEVSDLCAVKPHVLRYWEQEFPQLKVKLSGFGNFDLRDKKERPGRNPKTGEEIPITARRVVTFRPGQKLKARVEAYAGTGE